MESGMHVARVMETTQGRGTEAQAIGVILPALQHGLMRDAALFAFLARYSQELGNGDPQAMAELLRRFNCSAPSASRGTLIKSRNGEELACSALLLDVTYAYLAGLLPFSDWNHVLDVFRSLRAPVTQESIRSSACGRSPRLTHLMQRIGECVEIRTEASLVPHAVALLKTWCESSKRVYQ